jgi:hypothetical protein
MGEEKGTYDNGQRRGNINNIKMHFGNIGRGGMDGIVESSCERCNKSLASIQSWKCLEWLQNWWLP